MATYWTLTYSGTEKSFADWGFDEDPANDEFLNMAIDTVTLSISGGHIEDNEIIPFEGAVIIHKNRTSSGGPSPSYSGGAIHFQGKRLLHVVDGRPDFEGVQYQFGGPWYDLEQVPFLQAWQAWSSSGPTYTTTLISDVVLFQKVVAGVITLRNNGQMVTDILQSLLDQYTADGSLSAPYQIGTISPAVNEMTYQVKDIKCAEAIRTVLRPSPDAVVWFDYTTTPPTANCSLRGAMTGANVAIGDGVVHESVKLTPRYDLQARNVVIWFQQSNQDGTESYISTTKQKANPSGPDSGLRVVVQTVNLQGFTKTYVSGPLAVDTVANNRTWWKKYVPELQSMRIRAFTLLSSMTITDDVTGLSVSLTDYPNNVVDGTNVASWMEMIVSGLPVSVTAKRVTITVPVSYDQYDTEGSSESDTSGRKLLTFPRHLLTFRGQLTNGVSGEYSAVSSITPGETIPSGLAAAIYNALSVLQYDGTVTLLEPEVSGTIGMQNVLNLTGGRTEWTTMNAMIQSIRHDYGKGRTEFRIGPQSHLSAGDLTQIFLVNRFRQIWKNPATQGGAAAASGSEMDLGTNAPKENTATGVPELAFQMIGAPASGGSNNNVIQHDALGTGPLGSPGLLIGQVDTSGTPASGQPIVKGIPQDLADATNKEARFRWFYYRDAKSSCAAMKMKVWATAPEADT